ncbi:MAG: MurR/RpiR family transcriptional regulator [Rhizobiaceae bacterium]
MSASNPQASELSHMDEGRDISWQDPPGEHGDVAAKDIQANTGTEDLILRIRETREELKPAEARVADVVLRDPEFAVHASSATLAERAGVSEPTVTRFCRTLGHSGVRDFKLRLAQSLVVGAIYFRDRPASNPRSALPFRNQVFDHARRAIEQAQQQIGDTEIISAVDFITGSTRVLVFGVGGGSTTLAQETQFRLFRYGVTVTSYCDTYLMRMAVATLGPDDTAIFISATGRTAEMVEAAGIAHQYHARTIAITPSDTALSKAVDVALTVDVPEDIDVMKPTASRFAFLAVMDLLATAVGYRLGEGAQETLRRVKYNLLNFRDGEVLEPLGD